jgi:hypothetical protein
LSKIATASFSSFKDPSALVMSGLGVKLHPKKSLCNFEGFTEEAATT